MSVEPALSRTERKKAELRREILDAAFEAFAEQGYHATGIAEIAARLGIGHGTFYRYFANKRDIVEHVVTATMDRIIGALTAENAPGAVDTLAGYREQSRRIADTLGEIITHDPRVPRMLIVEAPGIDPQMADRILDFLDLAVELNAAYLAHGVERGYLRPDLDVVNTARAINGMILAAAIDGIRRPEPEHQRRLSAAIMAVMFDGVAS
ncbi:TetR/AcrR family transcriptional regulator [Nocardioides sp. Bht2]|uniref:TetR/AcrR family transcriptional regulator n=1 Tax=Nocardioides sp. Bht2 TaxID=3392297 RepID=UPI0039B5E45B